MRFNIAIFNPENKPIYIDQLKVLLQSIWDIYQNSVEISVYYTMMENKDIVEIKSKFPHIYTKESPIKYNYKNKNIPLAAQKSNLWYDLFVDCDTEKQVFIDADMMLLKKIDHFFDDSFDIGYTYKTEKDEVLWKPLNTGVILINNTEKARAFMTLWTEETNKMLDSDDPYGSGWGSADQKILGAFLGTKKNKKYKKLIKKNGIRFKGFPCKILNNTLSPNPDDPNVYLIHFKGSWRNILTDGNWERSIRTSVEFDHELYDLWHKKLLKFNQ